MPLTTAPSLLFGLGARILSEKLLRSHTHPRLGHTLLVGLWQGVALYYAIISYPTYAPGVALGIFVRLVADYVITHDAQQGAATFLGVALGVLGTDLLAQVFEDGVWERRTTTHRRTSSGTPPGPTTLKRSRLVQFRRSIDGESRASRQRLPTETTSTASTRGVPSITSSDTLDPHGLMSPLEREVAALRTRASLADTERRRYREEKKWAIAQGNPARAAQMRWQVKKYTALMQSFHREADARVVEASRVRPSEQRQPSASRPSTQDRHQRTVSVEIGSRQRKNSGNLQSAVRVNVR